MRETAAADAQHRLDVRELERRDTEFGGDPIEERTDRPFDVVARQSGAHLDLEEDPQEIGPTRADPAQACELGDEIESGGLPSLKYPMALRTCTASSRSSAMMPRAAAISRSETRPSDLATWPMTRKAVRKNCSPISHGARPGQRLRARLIGRRIVLMAEQHAQRRTHRAEREHADQSADELCPSTAPSLL